MISSTFFKKFRRVTYSGRYIPEIDGLRFIAIFSVVMLAHLGSYIQDSVLQLPRPAGLIHTFLLEGVAGVSLFFIISGFILSLPFAENKLLNGAPVQIKKYFFRRLTRLEPLYIITLICYFLVRVFILHYAGFSQLLPHFFASLFYMHNIIYNEASAINGVTWSLEVEIQFYILMPLLAYLYYIKNRIIRRGIFVILILSGTAFSYYHQYDMADFLNKGCYFFGGMLLADLYILNKKNFSSKIYTWAGVFFLLLSFFIPGYYVSVYFTLTKIICMLLYMFFILHNNILKRCFSFAPVAILGGMCYSIYLLHDGVLGLMRHRFAKIIFSNYEWLNISLHALIATAAMLVVSGIIFLLIEKPTMRRDWYKNLFFKKPLKLQDE
ncbi:MAG: acyltransferase [Ferruginibacter sp.]